MANVRIDGSGTVRVHSGDDELPAFSDDGVDLTLIRWMLSLTPLERLEVLQSAIASIGELRHDEVDD